MKRIEAAEAGETCYVGHLTESRSDAAMKRLLRVPVTTTSDGTAREQAAERLFSFAMVLSGLRCTLSYVILPFVIPALGLGAMAKVGPDIGIPIGVVALFFDVKGIRRFWVAGHKWRWQMTFIYLAVIGLVTYLVIGDVLKLL
ncbi:MAG: hypothetical protein M0Z91_05340 [Actinomycetota bacterium]|nr:hypothetical protein [Actinomycetota bacterium]